LYEFSKNGEHLILKIRKKDLTTWELIDILSNFLGVKSREFGYAGLKDKDGMTIQHISIHKKFEKKLSTFKHPKIKILEKTYHNNKIKIGHLKGNNFFIRLKKVNPVTANIINSILKKISKDGIPNYFGAQRFGVDGNNYELGKKVANGEHHIKDRKKEKFLISAYQSYLFNRWLSKRVEISKMINTLSIDEISTHYGYSKENSKIYKNQKQFFKVLEGDVMHHYPYGKIFLAQDVASEAEKFARFDRVPTGLLVGKKVMLSDSDARDIEKEYDDYILSNGTRRFAWISVDEIEGKYRKEEAWYELSFTLPKGSYATVLLEELLHNSLK
jgi:tRNA pseudouridine13 synthase